MRTGSICVAACAALLVTCRAPSSPVDVASATTAAAASNRFGFDLFDRLRDRPGNSIFSPASAEIALAMVSAGARGTTLDEMARALYVQGLARSHHSFGDLLRSLNAREAPGLTIHVANRLWVQEGLALATPFLSVMSNEYSAPVGEVDYLHAPEPARKQINAWAAHETRDRIQDLVAPGTITKWTRLVLADAVYFKGAWQFPFAASNTADADFTTADAGKTRVRMMSASNWFRYAKLDRARLVELLYKGPFSMLVLLPDDADGVPGLERRVAEYDEWLAKLRIREVDLKLPRWKTASEWRLAKTLAKMGMGTAFGDDANFSGITNLPLKIDWVIQKAFVESNEVGTEAAAATAIGMGQIVSAETPLAPPPAVFHGGSIRQGKLPSRGQLF